MKIISVIIVLLAVVMANAQEAKDLALQYGDQRIVVPAKLKTAKEGDRISIVVGKENSSPGKNAKSYGILLSGRGKNLLSRPFIELRDVSANRLIREITLGELFGKESDEWEALPDESSENAEKIVSGYSFKALDQHFKFYRTIQIISDDHLPTGKGVMVTFAIAGEKSLAMNMRFLGECDGTFGSEGNSFFIGDSASEPASRAMMVLRATRAASIKSEGKQRKGEPNRFTIESVPVNLTPGEQTTMMSLTIAGTTVGQPAHTATQAHNLLIYLNAQSSRPDLVAVTSVDRQNTNPGDTVIYTIAYHNIGTAPGKDIEINNPIPAGTRYLENTAGGDGGVINLTRTGQDVVTAVKWKFEVPILPGDHRSVRFKVVIQ
jgi:uncharacterized repeat protein (TIGR01451 family)